MQPDIDQLALTRKRWYSMRARCKDKGAKNWPHYGARGITVCERWNSFDAFVEDMGMCPAPNYSVDRIDPTLGYFAQNCQWATQSDQLRNRRKYTFTSVGAKSFRRHCDERLFAQWKHIAERVEREGRGEITKIAHELGCSQSNISAGLSRYRKAFDRVAMACDLAAMGGRE